MCSLMLAAGGGHREAISERIKAGADLEATDDRGQSAVFYAVGMNQGKAWTR